MNRRYWIAIIFMAIAGTFASPMRCGAQTQCPWLNAATAAGVLGGEVQATATALTPQGDTTCDFKRTQQASVFELKIAVHTMALPSRDFAAYLAQCSGTPVPLKAIGNEAFQCVPSNNSDNGGEQIIGRVRDRAFVIDIRRGSARQSTSPQNGLSEEARNIAEQVAGALF
ncbi:hypothetical protein HDF10_000677 [Edaphobacter lichenicola]|uniref:DUF3558 domain-containing protein n=1 Tax=Tunturiibacter lichenicola TaxID=2051959 RepID=A0A7W8J514_9BACT|nr:hypothetical protein [Edaphobacter lichenicola]